MTKSNKILILFTFIFSILFTTPTTAKQLNYNTELEYRIFTVLSSYKRFWAQDRDEPQDERDDRIAVLTSSIAEAVEDRPKGVNELQMAAVLMTIAYKETRLAKNVSIGRCDLMPEGQRCDNGLAKTYFQIWEVACPAVFDEELTPGSQKELNIAASCAARLYTSACNRCFNKNEFGAWAGGFSGYRSINCDWRPEHEHQSPKSRAEFMQMTYYKLTHVKVPESLIKENTH